MDEEYIAINPRKEWPKGPDIFYRCVQCNGVVSSQPNKGTYCACGNLLVAANGAQVETWSKYEVEVFRRR